MTLFKFLVTEGVMCIILDLKCNFVCSDIDEQAATRKVSYVYYLPCGRIQLHIKFV
jgi:hypothetical protein